MKRCKYCGAEIPKLRREAIPGVSTCVKCSDEPERVGFMDYAHKTAPEMVMVRAGTEDHRRAKAVFCRRR